MPSDLCPVYAPFFSAMGCTAAIVFTCIGASYGTAKSGVGISAMSVLRPDMMMKCSIPVVMAGIIAIYGLVVSVLIAGDLSVNMTLAQGFVQLGAGLSVGLAGLAAGFAVGIVGDAGVRGTAQQPRLFVGMILILIFSEVLGLYGLIVALIMNTKAQSMTGPHPASPTTPSSPPTVSGPMDSDRKSNVSSFYQAHATSGDALNSELPRVSSGAAGRANHPRDDVSSFYNPERTSMDQLNSNKMSAGYNRNSYFNMGREEPVKGGKDEEEAWDVYADFNNAGPRYNSAPLASPTVASNGYQQLTTPKSALPPGAETLDDNGNKVEMVTVPALGAEWGKDELRDMTKSGRKEKKRDRRRAFWKSWNRDQRGLCGKYFTRKVLVFFLFGLCAAIGIVLAFTIPRVPAFSFNSSTPLAAATGAWADAVPVIFSRAPANFSFPAFAALQLDTNANFLPLNFKHLKADVFDISTGRQVGTGDLGQRTIPAKGFPRILLPLNITYIARNDSDQTWASWYNACKNKETYPDGKRPPLQFRLLLDMSIMGLPGNPQTTAQIANAECPIELDLNAS
ncbi:hypothetical protein FA15DRAFT_701658 [Coprinopsis marcescibilis]|uniref:V-type proton ATPase subunit C n=1 Tax=Coprinopsis marcescibilis TaxID=230819 RepID=A0A5C3L3T2_COPMA|nr:hypothetical protein FA15DRAFT_701658 [Coprinopsis marcescibilis]